MANVKMRVDPNTGEKESIESMLRRFKKQVLRDGILLDVRKHEYYRSKSLKRKEKSKEAQRRLMAKKNKNKRSR